MTDKKFTKPPYYLDLEDHQSGENIIISVGLGGAPIAEVYNFDHFPCVDLDQLESADAEAIATARLFTSGPELLAAAEKVLADLNARLEACAKAGALMPVYNGIADLHDAINKAKSLTTPPPAVKTQKQPDSADYKAYLGGIDLRN